MRLELTGRHLDITPALRRLVDTKLARLKRVLNDSAVSAQAVLTQEKGRCRVEITLHARGEKFLHSVGTARTWEASLGLATDKIAQQAQKVKGKWQERKRRGPRRAEAPRVGLVPETTAEGSAAAGPPAVAAGRPRPPRILRTFRQVVKPMTAGEALGEIDPGRDGVVVFRDIETGCVSVVYRHSSGELALIETDA